MMKQIFQLLVGLLLLAGCSAFTHTRSNSKTTCKPNSADFKDEKNGGCCWLAKEFFHDKYWNNDDYYLNEDPENYEAGEAEREWNEANDNWKKCCATVPKDNDEAWSDDLFIDGEDRKGYCYDADHN